MDYRVGRRCGEGCLVGDGMGSRCGLGSLVGDGGWTGGVVRGNPLVMLTYYSYIY